MERIPVAGGDRSAEPGRSAAAGRLVPLEALRGILAAVVFLHHFVLSFAPSLSGWDAEAFGTRGLDGSPLFLLINGRAAVMCFCVVSGFVLTTDALTTGRSRGLWLGALKRWPRLAGPALLSVMGSLALFAVGGYSFVAAGQASMSPWLARFGDAYQQDPGFVPSFWGALRSGGFDLFATGFVPYNIPLWTLQVELFGGWIALLVAALLLRVSSTRRWVVGALAIAGAWASPWVGAFPIGVLLAWSVRGRTEPAGARTSWAALLVGLYLLGDGSGVGAYAWLGGIQREYVLLAGATLLLWCFVRSPLALALFRGRWSVWLGRISFPFYLVHMPVICSVGSWAYLAGAGAGLPAPAVVGLTLIATLGGCIVPVWAFGWFDGWWVRRVGRGAARVASALERFERSGPPSEGAPAVAAASPDAPARAAA